MYDMLGQKVRIEIPELHDNSKGDIITQVNVSLLPKGYYFLVAVKDSSKVTKKFVVEWAKTTKCKEPNRKDDLAPFLA